jgi:outer membrane protein assembly factor BamB
VTRNPILMAAIQVQGRVCDVANRPMKGIAVSNGETIVTTDADGQFHLNADPVLHPFIFATRPDWSTHPRWYAKTPSVSGKIRLILHKRKDSSPGPLRFGHVTDFHLDAGPKGAVLPQKLKEDLRWASSRASPPAFLIATGDLTDWGDRANLEALRKILEANPIPVLPLFGGHDGNWERLKLKKDPPWTRNWEHVLGPTYYSIDLTPFHLILFQDENWFFGPERTVAKQRWLDAELRRAKGKRIIIARHTPPNSKEIKSLARRGVRMILYGHCHSSKCHEESGVWIMGMPPLGFGGIDFAPAGVRTIGLDTIPPEIRFFPRNIRQRKSRSQRANPNVLWQARADIPLQRCQPLIAGGNVLIPLADEEFYRRSGVLCLDVRTGRTKWVTRTSASVRGGIAAAGDALFLVTQSGEVVALDQATGHPRWSKPLVGFPDRWIYGTPAIADQTLIAGTGSGGLQAFDIRTQSEKWRWRHPEGRDDLWPHHARSVIHQHRLMMMVARKGVSCLSVRTGELLWSCPLSYEYLLSPLIRVGEKLFTPEYPDSFRVLDSKTGLCLARHRTDAGSILSWAADARQIVLTTNQGITQACRAGDASLLWEFKHGKSLIDMIPYQRGMPGCFAPPLVTRDAILLGGLDGRLTVIEKKTGRILNEWNFGDPIVAIIRTRDRRVILLTYSGSIIHIDAAG